MQTLLHYQPERSKYEHKAVQSSFCTKKKITGPVYVKTLLLHKKYSKSKLHPSYQQPYSPK